MIACGTCHGILGRGIGLEAKLLQATMPWDCSTGTSWYMKNVEDADV